MKIRQFSLLESYQNSLIKLIVHAIVSVLYFYSTQIGISLSYNYVSNERFCLPLGKAKIG